VYCAEGHVAEEGLHPRHRPGAEPRPAGTIATRETNDIDPKRPWQLK
jgi:hypothetical protein